MATADRPRRSMMCCIRTSCPNWNLDQLRIAERDRERKCMVLSAEERRRVNWQNSQGSRGPRTEAGKNRARLNALTHGLASQKRAIVDPYAPWLSNMLAAWTEVYKPESAGDYKLIERAVVAAIQRQRSIAAVHRRLLHQPATTDLIAALFGDDEAMLYRTYERRHTAALRTALTALLKRRKEAASAAASSQHATADHDWAGEGPGYGYY
jgi:hypothetical protein